MSDSDLVLVDRLREAYWPRWMDRWASGHALRAEPRPYAPHEWRCRRHYDLGRVHFLVLEIMANGKGIGSYETAIKAIASILHVGPDHKRRGVRPARRSP